MSIVQQCELLGLARSSYYYEPVPESAERVQRVRATRDNAAWRSALDAVTAAARGTDNLVPAIIAAVEAMAAGAVPVVINKGGQPEIVQHGVNGFVWNTLDELKTYTQQLAEDPALRSRMSAAARVRAQDFSRERFVDCMSAACGVASRRGSIAGEPAIVNG